MAAPRSLGTGALTEAERDETDRDIAILESAGVFRPRTFGECEPGPCGYVSCRHHLKLDVDEITHVVRDNFPGVDVDEMDETCSLRVANAVAGNSETLTLEEVGERMNISMQWVQILERDAARKFRRRLELPGLWAPADTEGRQICGPCNGGGTGVDGECGNCGGEGYRWDV